MYFFSLGQLVHSGDILIASEDQEPMSLESQRMFLQPLLTNLRFSPPTLIEFKLGFSSKECQDQAEFGPFLVHQKLGWEKNRRFLGRSFG